LNHPNCLGTVPGACAPRAKKGRDSHEGSNGTSKSPDRRHASLTHGVAGCATESHRAVQVEHTGASAVPYRGPRNAIAVGKFDNRSTYLRGLFSDGVDRLGGQAKTILVGHLQETGRFNVLERENMEENAREAKLSGKQQTLKGADFTITGDVVEFGRKEIGDAQLFGILGEAKSRAPIRK